VNVTPQALRIGQVRLLRPGCWVENEGVKTGDQGAPVDVTAEGSGVQEVQLFRRCKVESEGRGQAIEE
jgi:hypothetical protein